MLKRLLIAVVCLSVPVPGQTPTGNGQISVNESLSKIRVTDDTISPNLVIENFGSNNSAHVQVELIDPADKVRASAETDAQLKAGSNHVQLELRAWKQKSEEWNESIWYRLRYNVTVSSASLPAAEGILALSTKADGVFDMRVITSQNALPGKSLRVRVYTQSIASLQPMAGVSIRAELEADDASKLTGTGVTDSRGFAQIEFNVPLMWTDSATVTVVASKGQVVRTASDDVSFRALWRFFVSTDKPLYQPGQAVHIRALLLDPNKHALAKMPLTFTISDEDDTIVYRANSETSRFGVASEEWEVPDNLRFGNYSIKVTPGDESDEDDYEHMGYQSIRISRYELPTFTVNVKADHAYYLPGQNAAVRVTADYLFGKPVIKGHVKIVQESQHQWNFKEQRWDITDEQKWEGDAANGQFVANIDLSKEQEGLGEGERYRDFQFAAYFTETATGKTEQRRFYLRVSRDPIHIYVIDAGNLAPGQLPLQFYISASYADGTPAQCELAIHQGSVTDGKPGALLRTAKTNKYGVARISGLNVPPLTSLGKDLPLGRLVVLARDKQGRIGNETEDLWDAGNGLAIQAKTDHALYRPNDPIEVDLRANRSDTSLLLDVLRQGRVIRSQSVRLHNSQAFVVLPYGSDFQGELTIAAYSPAESRDLYSMPIATRTVLYPHDPALKVTAKFDHAIYQPGEDAVLDLRVRSADGSPAEATLGAVIFDQAVEDRARTDAEFGGGQSYGFDAQFDNYWYENSQIGGLKRADLDQLNTSEPFPDDLQLTAEVVLLNRWGDRPSVFGGADYPAGASEVFRNRFDGELAPVKTALDDAYAKDFTYPHSPQSLKQILKAHNVDLDLVLDPWGSLFHATFSFNRSKEMMDVVSSGPDKKPGTDDDVTVMTIERPYFEKTGLEINKAMESYHSRTGMFIRDIAALKTELERYGAHWDSLRDPWGHDYQVLFGIVNTRYTLTVMSAGPNGRFEPGPASDDFPVWTTSTEYFTDTTIKIDSALIKHFAATQHFPRTEAEFYQVLNKGGISRNELHDAWGHPLQLVFDNEARYQDRVVIEYSELHNGEQLHSQKVEPETREYAFIHLYSPGLDGIPHTSDDFELATFSREIASQNSKMRQPNADLTTGPLSGGSGGITGVITDPSGAIVPQTKVIAELNGKVQFSAVSDDSGHYTIRNLPTGLYTVTATATGFRAAVITRVPVKSLSMTEVDLRLDVGATTETVEVSATAIALQTDAGEASASVAPHAGTGGPISTPRLREFFPETLLWQPMLETDSHGNSHVHFKFADSITDWKLSLIASTVDGQIGLLDTHVKTFQPFFVENDPPQVLTQGDEISLPVILRNYLTKPETLHVEMKAEPWFSFLGPSSQETSIGAGESEPALFKFRVNAGIDEVKQRVTAGNYETGDAVEKSVHIHPDGEPVTVTAARLFTSGSDLDVTVPDYTIPGSIRAEVKIYPNLMSHIVESTHSLLERPYGCGEQTISSTYPDVMVLKLYKQAGKTPDGVYRAALRYVGLGYARLLSYQHDDGGFSVWKQDKAYAPLTAYALRFLNDASEFISVDPNVVTSAQQWLLRQQTANGSWDNSLSETAYVTTSLSYVVSVKTAEASENKNVRPLAPALKAGTGFLQSYWSTTENTYDLAQVALAAFSVGDEALGVKVNAKLRSLTYQQGESSYWAMETNTLFYEWGRAGRAETTALAIQALEQESALDPGSDAIAQDRALAERGLIFLINQKDGYGAWYSGQTTVNVLNAFLFLGKAQDASAHAAAVYVNDEKAADVELPGSNEISAPFDVDISKFVKIGHNQVSIRSAGASQTASAQVVTHYYVPWDYSSAKSRSNIRTGDSNALALRVSYDETGLRPRSDIHCRVHAERVGFRGYGMLLTEIGLPPGAVVDRNSLDKAMNGSDWEISQYEIQPDRVIVYLWSKAGGTDFDFTFRERYEVNALTAPSILYDYYNPDAQTMVLPTRIDVRDSGIASR